MDSKVSESVLLEWLILNVFCFVLVLITLNIYEKLSLDDAVHIYTVPSQPRPTELCLE